MNNLFIYYYIYFVGKLVIVVLGFNINIQLILCLYSKKIN